MKVSHQPLSPCGNVGQVPEKKALITMLVPFDTVMVLGAHELVPVTCPFMVMVKLDTYTVKVARITRRLLVQLLPLQYAFQSSYVTV